MGVVNLWCAFRGYKMSERLLMRGYGWTKGVLGLVIFASVLFLFLSPAGAHKVMIFAWVEGDTIHTESKFSGGRKVKGGEVIVYDLDGKQLLKGKTNNRGEFSFKIAKKTGMKIVLLAGMGHRGEWKIPLEEIQGVTAEETVHALPAESDGENGERKARTAPVPGVGQDDIEKAVEKALDRKLKPVLKMLAESRECGPSVSEILGGIGYILGLMGVAAYFNYRRKSSGEKN